LDVFLPVFVDALNHIFYCAASLRRVKYALAIKPQNKVFDQKTTAVAPVFCIPPGTPVGVGYHTAQLLVFLVKSVKAASKGA